MTLDARSSIAPADPAPVVRRGSRGLVTVSLSLLLALTPSASFARTVAGVELPATLRLDGKALALASCGVRDTLWVEHYVAALYLRPGQDPIAALRDAAQPKVILMHIVRGASLPERIPPQWRQALRQELEREPLARVRAAYRALRSGDRVRIAYHPVTGISIAVNQREVQTVPSHALIDSMLRTWADGDPISGKLQRLLLEHPC